MGSQFFFLSWYFSHRKERPCDPSAKEKALCIPQPQDLESSRLYIAGGSLRIISISDSYSTRV